MLGSLAEHKRHFQNIILDGHTTDAREILYPTPQQFNAIKVKFPFSYFTHVYLAPETHSTQVRLCVLQHIITTHR